MATCSTDRDRVWLLLWRHNGYDCVPNHQPHHCLLNCLFGRRSKKTSKLCVTGLCVGNSPGTGEFPAQMASNAENVYIWWRHHVINSDANVGKVIHLTIVIIRLALWVLQALRFWQPHLCLTDSIILFSVKTHQRWFAILTADKNDHHYRFDIFNAFSLIEISVHVFWVKLCLLLSLSSK